MNIAGNPVSVAARISAAAVLALSVGCTVLEPTPPQPEPTDTPVIIHYAPAVRGNVAEIGEYLAMLQGLSADQLEQERQRLATQLNGTASAMTRVRYGLLLGLRGASVQELRDALSSIDDGAAAINAERDLAGWVAYVRRQLDLQLAAAERGQKLSQDRNEAVRGTEVLKRELNEQKAEIARLESQLNELKSIETSIIKREIEEGKKEP